MRTLFAISDLHLCLATPDKDMGVFGPPWVGYIDKLVENWKQRVQPQDVVAIAGDISWAMKLERALEDLQWLDELPGTKVFIRGNHDYWWQTAAKVRNALPPTCIALSGDALEIGPLAFAGTRLWETKEIPPSAMGPLQGPLRETADRPFTPDESIFERELRRLERALSELSPSASTRVVLTHYPPIGWQLATTRVSRLLEAHRVDFALFGHLHGVPSSMPCFGSHRGVRYVLTAADYLDFTPIPILTF